MKKLLILFVCIPLVARTVVAQNSPVTVDICVYGGSSAGVIAAYTAKKMGKSVILIEPGRHLGGLTTGGLGYTDIGNKYAISGIARDYYRRIGKHYGKFEQWIFEPHVAEDLFKDYVKRADVNVLYAYRLVSATKQNGSIQSITLEPSSGSGGNRVIKAKMFLDCTYEGDLMAKAGVSYTVGREDNKLYGETYNGVQLLDKHQFADGVDPYKIPGKPESGLCWGISPAALQPIGSGNKQVQTYNFRICLTSNPANMIPITKPEGYDSTHYELLLRAIEKNPKLAFNTILKPDWMPNQKTDINNNGPFSTDMIGMNYDFPEGSYQRRADIQRQHELYNKGLLYFIGHDPRMRPDIQVEMRKLGYPKDEYTDSGNWSTQMYVREARRMIGYYVMTQANCQGRNVVTDGVGMAAYTMDSHNCQRIVIEKNGLKMVKNEGDVQVGGFPPYPISYRCLIPKENECKNLLVPVCLSATHIAYGSIRMEPVFMVLAQSSAVAASMAIDGKTSVQAIDVKKLQAELKTNPLADGSTPEILVDNDDTAHTTRTGDWTRDNNPKGAYGPSYFTAKAADGEVKTVQFSPAVTKAGDYNIYIYFPKLMGASGKTTITVSDGKQRKDVTIREADIRVEGQTSGEWVPLGSFTLTPGQKSYVEVSTKEADGVVVADAVLFVPN
ncbi:FAD-dependent oxidoreductase [Spirosoma sp. KCTC 42546]|uniref:FAD-dependent oxidoreductase n=1 Tax=Spirosoma sp. KCTC 42546 TaxID=2520506 RepID=UPI001158533E|nr:FAD-dependent oxidoreductase [Spirosoma sp. KCTC 42546]QDK79842.1 FAD-dependent oxidoreductase [Spirosoma sp. KCTC 42546]